MPIIHTLSNWVANAVCVRRGENISYDGRCWMPAIFDTKSRSRICLTSRQVGKSTLGSCESLARLCKTDVRNILYVAPEQDQARKYSQDKVKPMIEESPIIKRMIGTYNNVHEKEFLGNKKLYLKYAKHNPDSCRGITADMIHYDEIQDQDLDVTEPVINESLFTSRFKLKLYTGTPKSFSNPAHERWKLSDQREWMVRCDHHLPAKWIKLEIRNIGKLGPICHHCGHLLDVDQGQWAMFNPGAKSAGFHVSQLNCKDSHLTKEDWEDLVDKLESYPEDKFLNEVMGESADSAEMPITETMLANCIDESFLPLEDPDPKWASVPTFAGIDWGHGSYTTAITIGAFDGKVFRYIYKRVFEGAALNPAFCIPEMAKIIRTYQCARVHVDYGGGFGLWDQLVTHIGNENIEVTGNIWSDNAKAKDMTWTTSGYTIPMLTLNKPKMISEYVNAIDQRRLKFCRLSEDEKKHFTNLRKEIVERRSDSGELQIRFTRAGHDDLMQASVYCWIIARLYYASA